VSRTFESAQLKIKRARKHIADLDAERIAFLDTDPCKVRAQYDPKSDRTSYIVENIEEVPPCLSLIAGDAVHNLRSALDHLVVSLVHKGKVTSQTAFPVFESFSKDKIIASGKIDGMSASDKKLLGNVQIYEGAYGVLCGLHRLDIIDKHKLLIAYTQCVGGMDYRFSDAELEDALGVKGILGDPVSSETRLITIPFENPFLVPETGKEVFSMAGNLEGNQHIQPGFDIALGDMEVFKGKLILPTLEGMATLVARIIKHFE
jgi:hypothetical protein